MKKILIFGGAFDPIHQAHIAVATKASQELDIPDVWFLLANQPRWKSNVTSYHHRYNMLSLAIKDYPNFKISEEEKLNTHTTYTIDTAYQLLAKYPETKFYYLIGTDQLERLHLWKDIDELTEIFQFVHIRRFYSKEAQENQELFGVITIDIDPIESSSTQVRQGDLSLVSKEVMDYIYEHQLYLQERIQHQLSPVRYEHSLRVAFLAQEIALANRYDEKKAFLAALLHDCAKELDRKTMRLYMEQHFPEKLNNPPSIYHQYVGAYLVQHYYKVFDQEIIDAVMYHATAKPKMTTLGKILFCADKLEEGRGWNSASLIVKCKNGIDGGFRQVLKENITHMLEQHMTISIETLDCANDLESTKIEEQLRLIVTTLDNRKAEDLLIYDVSTINPLTQYYVLATASSSRHAVALADYLQDEILRHGFALNRIEGRNAQDWILVDSQDVIIHLFTADAREKYQFEKLLSRQLKIDKEEIIHGKIK